MGGKLVKILAVSRRVTGAPRWRRGTRAVGENSRYQPHFRPETVRVVKLAGTLIYFYIILYESSVGARPDFDAESNILDFGGKMPGRDASTRYATARARAEIVYFTGIRLLCGGRILGIYVVENRKLGPRGISPYLLTNINL